MLSDEQRKQLDGIVSQMETAGETPETIQVVVNDFKSKHEGPGGWQVAGDVLSSPFKAAWGAAKEIATPVKSAMQGFQEGSQLVQPGVKYQPQATSRILGGYGEAIGRTAMLPLTVPYAAVKEALPPYVKMPISEAVKKVGGKVLDYMAPSGPQYAGGKTADGDKWMLEHPNTMREVENLGRVSMALPVTRSGAGLARLATKSIMTPAKRRMITIAEGLSAKTGIPVTTTKGLAYALIKPRIKTYVEKKGPESSAVESIPGGTISQKTNWINDKIALHDLGKYSNNPIRMKKETLSLSQRFEKSGKHLESENLKKISDVFKGQKKTSFSATMKSTGKSLLPVIAGGAPAHVSSAFATIPAARDVISSLIPAGMQELALPAGALLSGGLLLRQGYKSGVSGRGLLKGLEMKEALKKSWNDPQTGKLIMPIGKEKQLEILREDVLKGKLGYGELRKKGFSNTDIGKSITSYQVPRIKAEIANALEKSNTIEEFNKIISEVKSRYNPEYWNKYSSLDKFILNPDFSITQGGSVGGKAYKEILKVLKATPEERVGMIKNELRQRSLSDKTYMKLKTMERDKILNAPEPMLISSKEIGFPENRALLEKRLKEGK